MISSASSLGYRGIWMDPLLLAEDVHHDALAFLGARALGRGDPATAFVLADRRCRVRPLAVPEHFVLRAEAAWRIDQPEIAIRALRSALDIDPQHREANRRMLLWGSAEAKRKAARALLNSTLDDATATSALQTLAAGPEQAYVSAGLTGARITGWAAWRGGSRASLRLSWEQGATDISLNADPGHALLSILGNAVSFSLDWPSGAGEIVLDTPGIRSLIAGNPLIARGTAQIPSNVTARPEKFPVTVIIPVYADFDATRACLDSVIAAGVLPDWARILVVDDATPEPPIAELLDALVRDGLITLIRNQHNLGFVRSINRALRSIPNGDVILLNADTIVPPGFAERLLEAAHSAPDIATVTPLSNNGETTSFPLPFEPNRLPDRATVLEIDRIAAEVNAGRVVTIPNGIGFCLYVRRDALARLGLLSEGLRRGYLEDVEFCLRARRHGLRNVCATSVYVGHAGERSFQQEKRSLVVSNLKSVEAEYPRYRNESSAFMALDPLRRARDSIQFVAPTTHGGDLLLAGIGPTREIAWTRAKALAAGGARVVVAELNGQVTPPTAVLSDAFDALPQRLTFAIGPEDSTRFVRYVRDQQFRRIEIVDPAAMPLDLAHDLLALGIPCDFFIASDALHPPPHASAFDEAGSCAIPGETKLWGPDVSRTRRTAAPRDMTSWRQEWRSILDRCGAIWAPDPEAFAFFRNAFPVLSDRLRMCAEKTAGTPSWTIQGHRLGLLPLDHSATAFAFVLSLARAFQSIRSETELMVLGQTFDDLRILGCGNAFVSGAVKPDEIVSLLPAFGIRGVLLGTSRALFGHASTAAATSSGIKTVSFRWGSSPAPGRRHLSLDGFASAEEWALQLDQWLRELEDGRGAPT